MTYYTSRGTGNRGYAPSVPALPYLSYQDAPNTPTHIIPQRENTAQKTTPDISNHTELKSNSILIIIVAVVAETTLTLMLTRESVPAWTVGVPQLERLKNADNKLQVAGR